MEALLIEGLNWIMDKLISQRVELGEYVRNLDTDEIGWIRNYCNDPYAISEGETVAYVICVRADESTYSDHWALNCIEVL